MPFIPRAEVLSGMRQKIAEKRPVIGAGAGSGLSAKCEEAGGADLIIIYNSGRFRLPVAAPSPACWPTGTRTTSFSRWVERSCR
jgi:predicted TIM-barrel enzyme